MTFNDISNNFSELNKAVFQVSLVKLERMGYLSKTIETDDQYYGDFYAYSVTDMGIDILLENEYVIQPNVPEAPKEFDDDIPF